MNHYRNLTPRDYQHQELELYQKMQLFHFIAYEKGKLQEEPLGDANPLYLCAELTKLCW